MTDDHSTVSTALPGPEASSGIRWGVAFYIRFSHLAASTSVSPLSAHGVPTCFFVSSDTYLLGGGSACIAIYLRGTFQWLPGFSDYEAVESVHVWVLVRTEAFNSLGSVPGHANAPMYDSSSVCVALQETVQ